MATVTDLIKVKTLTARHAKQIRLLSYPNNKELLDRIKKQMSQGHYLHLIVIGRVDGKHLKDLGLGASPVQVYWLVKHFDDLYWVPSAGMPAHRHVDQIFV